MGPKLKSSEQTKAGRAMAYRTFRLKWLRMGEGLPRKISSSSGELSAEWEDRNTLSVICFCSLAPINEYAELKR